MRIARYFESPAFRRNSFMFLSYFPACFCLHGYLRTPSPISSQCLSLIYCDNVKIRKYWLVLRWMCSFVAPRSGIFPVRGATKLHIHRKWTSLSLAEGLVKYFGDLCWDKPISHSKQCHMHILWFVCLDYSDCFVSDLLGIPHRECLMVLSDFCFLFFILPPPKFPDDNFWLPRRTVSEFLPVTGHGQRKKCIVFRPRATPWWGRGAPQTPQAPPPNIFCLRFRTTGILVNKNFHPSI